MSPHQDVIWQSIRQEVARVVEAEPALAGMLHNAVLSHKTLADALGYLLARKLADAVLDSNALQERFSEALSADASIIAATRADLEAVVTRDPACESYHVPLIYYKGFHVLQAHRVAHWLWNQGRRSLARYLQSRMSELWAVDIHPAARIGKAVLFDHATSIVVGETAVIEDEVSLLHEVTLGGTGKQSGDRHPKVRRGVLIGAGAKILGNVEIGEGAKIGAGSVVLTDVPPHSTAVGVPAKIVGHPTSPEPSLDMDHGLSPEEYAQRSPGG
jgi:serine O-acetyltransferase